MRWWPPWQRHADRVIREETHNDDQRLKESQELRARAKRVGKNLKRRNRFGEMLDREVFGGK